MSSLRSRLGQVIRQLRSQAGHSQEGFADVVGVHRTYVGAVERGEVNVSLDNIERIAAALGTTPGQLLVRTERSAES